MAKASDNPYPSVLVVEGTVPANPASGDQRVYIDSSDHKLKRVNSSGTVTTIESGGTAPVELGYVQVTSPQTGIGTGLTDVTSMTLTVTVGSRAIIVEFYCPLADATSATDRWLFQLVDVTASNTVVGEGFSPIAGGEGGVGTAKVRVAPSAGSRTYKVKASNGSAPSGARLYADATAPMWLRIYEV